MTISLVVVIILFEFDCYLYFYSFEAFCEMMVTAARYKKEENQRLNSNNLSGCDEDDATLYYINALTNMGYLAEHIDIVLSSVEPNKTSLEELLSRLHELTVSIAWFFGGACVLWANCSVCSFDL